MSGLEWCLSSFEGSSSYCEVDAPVRVSEAGASKETAVHPTRGE